MERMKFITLLCFFLCGIYYFVEEDIDYRLCALLSMSLIGIVHFKFDALYPFVWLTPILILYHVSIYILELLGFRTINSFDIILNSLYLSVLSFFLYCKLFIKQRSNFKLNCNFLANGNDRIIFKLLLLFSFYLILCIPLFLRSGYSSKMELNRNGGILGMGLVSNFFLLLYILFIIYRVLKDGKFPLTTIFYASAIALSISLFIGERELFLTIAISSFLIYYKFYRPKLIKILAFGVVGLLLVSVLGEFRQITNQVNDKNEEKTVAESVLGGEFVTSGRNFGTILDNKSSWDYQYGSALVNDMLHSVIPSFIINIESTAGWYNKKYNTRVDEGWGAGFSYLAEGYLQCGYLGVVIWTIILAFIMQLLYRQSHRSLYGFAAYLFMICDTMYSMRGDLSFIISPLLKQVVFMYFFLKFIFRVNFSSNQVIYKK